MIALTRPKPRPRSCGHDNNNKIKAEAEARVARSTLQLAQLWQRDCVSSAILRGWVNLRLNFRLQGYVPQ